MIRVLQCIFSIKPTPFPSKNTPIEEIEKQLKIDLTSIIGLLNPKIEIIDIKFSGIAIHDIYVGGKNYNDVSGTITIEAKHKDNLSNFNIFSFDLVVDISENGGHSRLKNIQVPNINKVPGVTNNYVLNIQKNTMEESLLLLAETSRPFINHPFYKLCPTSLDDNPSKVAFVGDLDKEWNSLPKQSHQQYLLMLANIISSISWDDDTTVELYTNRLVDIFGKSIDANFKLAISQNTQALYFYPNFIENEWLIKEFPSLKRLVAYFNSGKNFSLKCLMELKNLEELRLGYYNEGNIQLEFFPKLKRLIISSGNRLKLTVPKGHILRELTIISANIINIQESLENLSELEELNFNSTSKPGSLTFSGANKNLARIDFSTSSISDIRGLDQLPVLKKLILCNTKQLYKFPNVPVSLEELYIKGSKVTVDPNRIPPKLKIFE